jgi:hypothetical protein
MESKETCASSKINAHYQLIDDGTSPTQRRRWNQKESVLNSKTKARYQLKVAGRTMELSVRMLSTHRWR